MSWLKSILEKVCNKYNITLEDNNKIRTNNFIISIDSDNNLYSIKAIDLINFNPPIITGPMFYDEIEDNLSKAVQL